MTNCTGYIEPLNLECIFVNNFAGSPDYFLGLAFIVLAALSGIFRMNQTIFLILVGLFVTLMAGFGGLPTMLLLVFIAIGSLIFFGITKKIPKD